MFPPSRLKSLFYGIVHSVCTLPEVSWVVIVIVIRERVEGVLDWVLHKKTWQAGDK